MKKIAVIITILVVLSTSFGLNYAFQSAHSSMAMDAGEVDSCTERSALAMPFSCFTHCLLSATSNSQPDKMIPLTSLIFSLALLAVAGIFVFAKSKWLPVLGNLDLYFQPLYLFKTVVLKE
ncbi:hypothetical protein KKF61_04685 [Patescibacteria group bacterium]|nr:hypothetical protein [Patescibacteria group bacterium]MBU0964173.1 hypothetical protein [Patescibacteria group bacterium]